MSTIIKTNKLISILSLVLLGGCVAEDANMTVISDGTMVVTADLEFLGERLFNDLQQANLVQVATMKQRGLMILMIANQPR